MVVVAPTIHKPQATGGRLIREMIGFLKKQELALPLSSHILIASSGGLDSTALVLILVKYGRRIVPREKIKLLHINHHWRGEQSKQDERWVRALAARLGVGCIIRSVAGPKDWSATDRERSWEDVARRQRREIYQELSRTQHAVIFTAHHGDDLAETVLWRLFTGAAQTHGGGIRFRNGSELRPLLGVRKQRLKDFLIEEGQDWREDGTNHEARFMRARMRKSLMPVLEELFPQAVPRLMEWALERQGPRSPEVRSEGGGQVLLELFQTLSKNRGSRRTHWQTIERWIQDNPRLNRACRALDLAAGWRLIQEIKPSDEKKLTRRRAAPSSDKQVWERWILERKHVLARSSP